MNRWECPDCGWYNHPDDNSCQDCLSPRFSVDDTDVLYDDYMEQAAYDLWRDDE